MYGQETEWQSWAALERDSHPNQITNLLPFTKLPFALYKALFHLSGPVALWASLKGAQLKESLRLIIAQEKESLNLHLSSQR
jgi:uncharacterized Tic20 family protein